jgi:hypothetical protein
MILQSAAKREYPVCARLVPGAVAPGFFHARTAVIPLTVTAAEAPEIDPFALLTARQCAGWTGLTEQAMYNWWKRGHLPQAVDDNGKPLTDLQGKRLYRLVDLAKADAKMAAQREQMALRILASHAA